MNAGATLKVMHSFWFCLRFIYNSLLCSQSLQSPEKKKTVTYARRTDVHTKPFFSKQNMYIKFHVKEFHILFIFEEFFSPVVVVVVAFGVSLAFGAFGTDYNYDYISYAYDGAHTPD